MFTSADYDKLQHLMAENAENRALLEKLLSAHEESVASISHEIRNPLTLVYSTLQLLETRHPKITSDKYWQSMRQDVEYMQALLTDLSSLNHSRSLRLSAFSFRAFMEELVLSFAASCADGPVTFTSRLDPALPVIRGDRIRLREVFLNLLRNAGEAVDGTGSICLDASFLPAGPRAGNGPSAPGDACILVTVRDTGCGIPKEQLSHIFEPFFTCKPNGTGLGLAIADRTVRAHGGRILVRSSVQAGTEFRVFLPVQEHGQEKPGGQPADVGEIVNAGAGEPVVQCEGDHEQDPLPGDCADPPVVAKRNVQKRPNDPENGA